jgi:hypothetical protein
MTFYFIFRRRDHRLLSRDPAGVGESAGGLLSR